MRRDLSQVLIGLCCLAAGISQCTHAGGLYHPDAYAPLTSDYRAFKVGDAITVMIVESASAESDAESDTNRNLQITAGLQGSSTQHTAGASLSRQNTNNGTTTRNGSLQAEITARVQSIAANGDLAIHGTQSITVNGETQRIELSGVVRSIDVSAGNVVQSTRLSNASIEYSGKGFVDRSQSEGIISRVLDFFGL